MGCATSTTRSPEPPQAELAALSKANQDQREAERKAKEQAAQERAAAMELEAAQMAASFAGKPASAILEPAAAQQPPTPQPSVPRTGDAMFDQAREMLARLESVGNSLAAASAKFDATVTSAQSPAKARTRPPILPSTPQSAEATDGPLQQLSSRISEVFSEIAKAVLRPSEQAPPDMRASGAEQAEVNSAHRAVSTPNTNVFVDRLATEDEHPARYEQEKERTSQHPPPSKPLRHDHTHHHSWEHHTGGAPASSAAVATEDEHPARYEQQNERTSQHPPPSKPLRHDHTHHHSWDHDHVA